MSDRWQDDAEYQRRKKIDWADTGINIDYAAEWGVEAYKRWLAAGGGSITPHPEACATCGGTGVRWQDGAPDECLDCDNFGRAAGGSPTTTPDGKQAFDSPGVLKDAAPTITPQPNGPPPYSPDIHNEPRVTTTPTTEQVDAALIAYQAAYSNQYNSYLPPNHRSAMGAALVAAFLVTPTPEEPS